MLRLLFLSNCFWFYVFFLYILEGYWGCDFSENYEEKLIKDVLFVGDLVLFKDMLEIFFLFRDCKLCGLCYELYFCVCYMRLVVIYFVFDRFYCFYIFIYYI